MPNPGEHEAFALLIDSIEKAASAARTICQLRPDQNRGWEAIGDKLNQFKEICFQLVESGLETH
jgi:hypothetical protein